MPSIRMRVRKDGKVSFHVQVRVTGHESVTNTFSNREDAETWGKFIEAEIRGKKKYLTDLAKKTSTKKPYWNTERISVPPHCGCYLLFDGTECVYIGSSKGSILWRLAQHARRFAYDSYSIIECEEKELLALEYQLIAELQPKHNRLGRKATSPRKAAENTA